MTALRKLLVVDDDPVVSTSFRRVLSGKGYIVVSAENGQEALEKIHGERFDAVFTDLRMPGMDGMQVAREIRSSQPWTPVVIVTGYGSESSEARARALGVSDFVRKPLSPEMIEETADKAVRTVPEGAAAPATELPPVAEAAAAPPAEAAPEPRSRWTMLRNAALFLLGPFIGLLYAVLLPFVGLGMLAYVAWEGVKDKPRVRDFVGAGKVALKLVAAPFVGLAWIVVMPFVGLAALALMAVKAAFVHESAE